MALLQPCSQGMRSKQNAGPCAPGAERRAMRSGQNTGLRNPPDDAGWRRQWPGARHEPQAHVASRRHGSPQAEVVRVPSLHAVLVHPHHGVADGPRQQGRAGQGARATGALAAWEKRLLIHEHHHALGGRGGSGDGGRGGGLEEGRGWGGQGSVQTGGGAAAGARSW